MASMYPGDVVAVRVGPFKHLGVVSDRTHRGTPMILSRSRRLGYAAEEPLGVFTQGGRVYHRGYLGRLPREEVVRRARARLNSRWDLLTANCEHYVYEAHGLRPQSPTLRGASQVAAAALIAFVVVAAVSEA